MPYTKREKSRLHQNIKALCQQNGIRLQDVEKEIGRASGFLSRGSTPSADELFRISKILKVNMDDLMTKDYMTDVIVAKALNKLWTDIQNDVERMRDYLDKDDLMRQFIRIVNRIYEVDE